MCINWTHVNAWFGWVYYYCMPNISSVFFLAIDKPTVNHSAGPSYSLHGHKLWATKWTLHIYRMEPNYENYYLCYQIKMRYESYLRGWASYFLLIKMWKMCTKSTVHSRAKKRHYSNINMVNYSTLTFQMLTDKQIYHKNLI